VTDVAEERGFGAIQLGELFGAPALVLERAHPGKRTRDVGADQPHEVAIVVVELAPRAQPADEIAVGFVGASRELEDRGVLHGFRPRPARQVHVRGRLREHDLRIAPEWPGLVTIRRIDQQRCASVAGRDARCGFEPCGAGCSVPAVKSGERYVLAVVLQDGGAVTEDVAGRSCAVADATEIAQCRQPALADDATRGLTDDAENAADPARFVAHRIVRDVEVRLLDVAVTLDHEHQILRPERIAGVHDAGKQRLQHVPQLAPAFPAGQA
jgi:hypothetical protein